MIGTVILMNLNLGDPETVTGASRHASPAAPDRAGDRLHVLIHLRADWRSNPGGDSVEAERLSAELTRLGHRVVIAEPGLDFTGHWHVVHLFNINRSAEAYRFFATHGFFPGSRVVLTPVFHGWPRPTRAATVSRHLLSVANLVRASARPSLAWIPGHNLRFLRRRVRSLIFHTTAEQRLFGCHYPGFAASETVIPPPVDHQPRAAQSANEISAPLPQRYLAVVARVEPLKQQLWLLDSGVHQLLPIVFVGGANPKRAPYVRRFVRRLEDCPDSRWLGRCHPRTVRHVLANAVAHVLPSRRENFGLATLEALDAGCEALVPDHHLAANALSEWVHHFDPARPESLRARVNAVLNGERKAPGFDRSRFSVATVATATLRTYLQSQSTSAG